MPRSARSVSSNPFRTLRRVKKLGRIEGDFSRNDRNVDHKFDLEIGRDPAPDQLPFVKSRGVQTSSTMRRRRVASARQELELFRRKYATPQFQISRIQVRNRGFSRNNSGDGCYLEYSYEATRRDAVKRSETAFKAPRPNSTAHA